MREKREEKSSLQARNHYLQQAFTKFENGKVGVDKEIDEILTNYMDVSQMTANR